MLLLVKTLIDALGRNPDLVISMVRQADPSVLKRRPRTGKWSIHEHACHLARADEVYLARLEIMLASERPVIKSYDPGRDDPDDALLRLDLQESLGEDRGTRRVQLLLDVHDVSPPCPA